MSDDETGRNAGGTTTVSPALLAANQRLLARRAAQAAPQRWRPLAVPIWPDLPDVPERDDWTGLEMEDETEDDPSGGAVSGSGDGQATPMAAAPPPQVKSYPDLSLAALKAGEAALYRVWLLIRLFDQTGQGWVDVSALQQALTGAGATASPWRTFSRERLRQILIQGEVSQGERLYWQREQNGQRLRYQGVAALAERLAVPRLTGRAVHLPLRVLTGNIGRFKAELVASWHAGRQAEGDDRPRPVSRAALQSQTGVSARTLQRYDRRANVRRRRHIAVAGCRSQAAEQEYAWRHGRAVFPFVDYQGKQGRPGATYLARQLPNSYASDLKRANSGRQRKINKRLNQPRDCVARGAGRVLTVFHANGCEAAAAYNRQPDQDAYWPARRLRDGGRLWAVLPAVG